MRSANDLNPDITGRASPILLRVYELKGRNAFIGADFFPLYQDERSVLTDDLLGKEELLVRPGETRQISRTLDAQTQHIGFFAAYRDLDNAMWRSTLPVLAHQLTPIEVHLGRLNLKARVSSR